LIDPVTGNAYYVQDLFAKLLGNGTIYNATAKGIVDRAATPLWPAQPFVQPLMVDVTAQTRITQSNVSAQGEATVSVRNIGTSPLAAPLKLVVEGLSAGVALTNASGSVYGNPYLALPSAINPGSTVNYRLRFSNPNALPISYTVRVHSGGV
jgi:hypothetical protein